MTRTVLPSTKYASPLTTSTLLPFNSPSTPPTNFLTTLFLNSCAFAQSSLTSAAITPMSSECFACSKRWPTEIKALDGIHPTFKQTPPNCAFSTTVTFCPVCAARIAATYPPGPAPTTRVSSSIGKSPTTIIFTPPLIISLAH